MINFKRDSDNLIVAGNGPSLKNIDLNSLPSNFDVFRCNQFYAEKQYYIGKNIKLVMFNPQFIYSQLKTIQEISKNQEYEIEYICLNYVNKGWDENFDLNELLNHHPYIYTLKDLLNYKYLKELSLYNYYDNLRPTSGILLMLLGKSLGYKNIYYIGMDFLEGNNLEQIDFNKTSNINKMIYKNNNFENMHDKLIDEYFLNLTQAKKLGRVHDQINFINKANNSIIDIVEYNQTNLKPKIKKKFLGIKF
ncbi:alpha-2,3-sialyltransferase [Campylobacter sp. RM5004]|uniref:alpha-2,3-sialyltransferase n=1 Tax=Campylobacter sp. RM5004 TaxID=1660078 RepID=UPI001EFBD059|nr:alpha-2,3-sialyltransferase [Campylobacter sp. RM5004]ULO02439.1 alpha-2,3-sialyltransferase [Campylobacter sp. RM5004]